MAFETPAQHGRPFAVHYPLRRMPPAESYDSVNWIRDVPGLLSWVVRWQVIAWRRPTDNKQHATCNVPQDACPTLRPRHILRHWCESLWCLPSLSHCAVAAIDKRLEVLTESKVAAGLLWLVGRSRRIVATPRSPHASATSDLRPTRNPQLTTYNMQPTTYSSAPYIRRYCPGETPISL